jgi:hypothetical protein
VASAGRPDLYQAEVSAAGPAGTEVALPVEQFDHAGMLDGSPMTCTGETLAE